MNLLLPAGPLITDGPSVFYKERSTAVLADLSHWSWINIDSVYSCIWPFAAIRGITNCFRRMAALGRWSQPVDATHWLNRSAGVYQVPYDRGVRRQVDEYPSYVLVSPFTVLRQRFDEFSS